MAETDNLRHVLARIAASRVETQPFPHIVVDDFLPEATFEQIRAHWPSEADWQPDNFGCRYDLAMPESGTFAEAFAGWLEPANRMLYARLRPHLGVKYAPYDPGFDLTRLDDRTVWFGGARLCYYTGQSGMKPHVDNVRIVTNSFLYVGDEARERPELGTTLYRGLGLMVPTNWDIPKHVIGRAVKPEKVVAYRRNRCFSYVNGPTSLHGVEDFAIGEEQRRLVMFGALMATEATRRLVDAPLV